MNKVLSAIFACVISANLFAQNTTIGDSDKSKSLPENERQTGKILLIPFEPRLYLSEIDKKLGAENELTFRDIRNGFRSGLDKQILAELKKIKSTYSLFADTSETMADLALIYKSIGYNYDLVPVEGQAVAKSTTSANKAKVKDGQLAVEMNYDKRFMNTSIKNPNLLEYLHKKYNADFFVFINELDLKHDPKGEIDLETGSYPREATVHFTVFNKSGKTIASGISATGFSPALNDPQKIVYTVFPAIAKDISQRTSRAILIQKPEVKRPAPSKQ